LHPKRHNLIRQALAERTGDQARDNDDHSKKKIRQNNLEADAYIEPLSSENKVLHYKEKNEIRQNPCFDSNYKVAIFYIMSTLK